jgi:hypothetical protein
VLGVVLRSRLLRRILLELIRSFRRLLLTIFVFIHIGHDFLLYVAVMPPHGSSCFELPLLVANDGDLVVVRRPFLLADSVNMGDISLVSVPWEASG